jgi:hypothetical protein
MGQGEQVGDVGRRARGEEKLRLALVGSWHERRVWRSGASGQAVALAGGEEKIGAVKSGGRGPGDMVGWRGEATLACAVLRAVAGQRPDV